jgi:DNA-binding SARP family transcriptional activator
MAGFQKRDDEYGILQVETQRSHLLRRRGELGSALELALSIPSRAIAINNAPLAALALRYAGLAHWILGQWPQAETAFQSAIGMLKDPSSRRDLGMVMADLAGLMIEHGNRAKAAHLRQQVLTIWRELELPDQLAYTLNEIGCDLHRLGQYESAYATLLEARHWAGKVGNPRLDALILTSQGDLLADTGNRKAASEAYRQAMSKLERADDSWLKTYLCWSLALLDRKIGSFLSALEWLKRAEVELNIDDQTSLSVNIEATRGIILVDMDRVRDGRDLLERASTCLENLRMPQDLAQVLLLRARAEYRSGDIPEAVASLSRAFALADQVGYDQMLVREVLPAQDMLEALRNSAEIGPRVAHLLQRAQRSAYVPLSDPRGALPLGDGRVRENDPTNTTKVTLQALAFGKGRIIKDGAELSRAILYSTRVQEVLLFLIDRMPIERDRILGVFWPDKTTAQALNNLYQMLFRIRRAIGLDVIVLEEQVCRLADDVHLDYDVANFEAKAREVITMNGGDLRRSSLAVETLSLYEGDYLVNFDAQWALARRQTLCDLHLTLLCIYADELMNLTRYAEARDVLSRVLTVEPLREDAHQRMLVCLAGVGRRYEVVDHYRRYREMLRTELGLDPPPEMRALYSRLLS